LFGANHLRCIRGDTHTRTTEQRPRNASTRSATGSSATRENLGTPASQCTGYGDQAIDQNGQSVDVWRGGLRMACGYSYENGDNPMPAGTRFPPPRPFRMIEHTGPIFGFKVFYHGADTVTPWTKLDFPHLHGRRDQDSLAESAVLDRAKTFRLSSLDADMRKVRPGDDRATRGGPRRV